jgi:hypothetical protein
VDVGVRGGDVTPVFLDVVAGAGAGMASSTTYISTVDESSAPLLWSLVLPALSERTGCGRAAAMGSDTSDGRVAGTGRELGVGGAIVPVAPVGRRGRTVGGAGEAAAAPAATDVAAVG